MLDHLIRTYRFAGNTTKCLLIFGLMLFFLKNADSQVLIKDFYFKNPAKNKIEIPFRLIHNLIIIPLYINDSDTLHFILDTGVKTTLITELETRDSFKFKVSQTITVAGMGSGEPTKALHSWDNTISMHGVEGKNQDILILKENELFLSKSMGTEINGIIGYDFFKSFIVEINYSRRKLTLRKPGNLKLKSNGATIPLKIVRSKPYVPAIIFLDNGHQQEIQFLLDLGASFACSIFDFLDDSIYIPEPNVETVLGKGLNGPIKGRIGRIIGMKLGSYHLNQPVIAFPDSNSVTFSEKRINYKGSIGSDILTRFNVIISYTDGILYIKKNRYYAKPFTFNTSGIDIIKVRSRFPTYEVDFVRKGSPADSAGILYGDIIQMVNGKPVTEFRFQELIELLNSNPGRRIYIRIMRNGKIIDYRLELRDII